MKTSIELSAVQRSGVVLDTIRDADQTAFNCLVFELFSRRNVNTNDVNPTEPLKALMERISREYALPMSYLKEQIFGK